MLDEAAVGQKRVSFCWSCTSLILCFMPHPCVLWEGIPESLWSSQPVQWDPEHCEPPSTCPEHTSPCLRGVGMKGTPTVVLGSPWRGQLCLYTCCPSRCHWLLQVLEFTLQCVQPSSRSGEVFCAVGGAGEAAVGHCGGGPHFRNFRSLPNPLQQHGGLSFGYKRL